jgi:hypothetical protein
VPKLPLRNTGLPRRKGAPPETHVTAASSPMGETRGKARLTNREEGFASKQSFNPSNNQVDRAFVHKPKKSRVAGFLF